MWTKLKKCLVGVILVGAIISSTTPAAAVQINGQLEKALLEKLSSDPTAAEARIYWNTTSKKALAYDGSAWSALAYESATAPDVANGIQNCSVAASVASSAVTFALKTSAGSDPSAGSPCKIGFSTSSAVAGGFSFRTISSATSFTVSSGSTLGHASSVNSPVYVYAFDNSGAVVLGASGEAYSDEVSSTTAEGGAGAADSNSAIYTSSALTSKPKRLLASFMSSQTTAGTWASALTTYIFNPNFREAVYANCYSGTGSITGSLSVAQWSTCTDISGISVSSGVFTIKYPGLYSLRFSVDVSCASSVDNNLIQLEIQKNGSTINYTNTRFVANGGGISLNGNPVSSIVRLAAGDTVRGRVSSGCTTPTYSADSSDFFQIAKLAD